MSREVRYKTEIVIPQPQLAQGKVNVKDRVLPGSPCWEMLKAAVEQVAREQGGNVSHQYDDCNGNRHDCLFAMRTPNFPRGVGINVDAQGQVHFVYDEQRQGSAVGSPNAAQGLCAAISQAYAARAVHRALQVCGFQTQDQVHQQQGQRYVLVQGAKTL